MAAALCWLAAAIWLAGGRRSPARLVGAAGVGAGQPPDGGGAGQPPGGGRAGQRRLSPRALRWLAAGAIAVASVAIAGPVAGGVAGAVAAPVVLRLVAAGQARELARVPAGSVGRIPLVLDLLAAALRSGQPVGPAVACVAPLAGPGLAEQLQQVAGLLRFGADPAVAWASLDDPSLAPIVRTAVRSAESGVRLARGFGLLAAELRNEARAAAVARANRAGVWAMVPLGLCFLPAFACLGVLPVIVGIAHGVLGSTP
jgi:pilus assembly protein TadC